jgi:hypothetical protein
MYTQKQFESLPKWAQREIERLKNNTADLERDLAKVLSGTSGITVYGTDLDPIGYLPKYTSFKLGDLRVKFAYLYSEREQFVNTIEVSCSRQLIVHPRAANLVFITQVDF